MHLNKVLLMGRVGERGVKLTYDNRTALTCAFLLEIDEPGKDGRVFTGYFPIEIVGKFAEELAALLHAGDEIMVDGRLKYRSHINSKTAQKSSKLIVTSWTVTRGTPTHAQVAP